MKRLGENETLYITPAAKAKSELFDPLKNAQQVVLDAVNVGMLSMNQAGEDRIKCGITDFVSHYELFG